MHMIIAIVLLFTVYAVNGTARRDRPGRHRRRSSRVPAPRGRRPSRRHHHLDRRFVPTSPTSPSTMIRAHRPGDVVRSSSSATARRSTTTVALGEPERRRGVRQAFLGVELGQRGASGTTSRSPEPSVHSFTDLGRRVWQSVGGVVKVINPVNIYEHLVGDNADPNTQPTTVVGISRLQLRRSATRPGWRACC